MPKIKTCRAAAKRFRVSASGRLMRRRQNTSHILTKKTTKRKRHLRSVAQVADADTKRIKRLLGL